MSLCTLAQYHTFTGDSTRSDADVTAALANAQTEIEELTERKFELATRTETLVVQSNGCVYPSAYPVTSVTLPSTAVINSPAVIVTSVACPPWDLSTVGNPGPTTQSVTYTGGYAAVPRKLQRLCAQMAQYLLTPSDPVGQATEVSTEDLEGYATPPLAVLTEWPPSILRQINRWRHIKTKLPL